MLQIGERRYKGAFFDFSTNIDIIGQAKFSYFDKEQLGYDIGSEITYYKISSDPVKKIKITCEQLSDGLIECTYPYAENENGEETKRLYLPGN